MTDQTPGHAGPTAGDGATESLIPMPLPVSGGVIPSSARPGSPLMIDPEGKIRSGQFRGAHRLSRHPSHRPFEKD